MSEELGEKRKYSTFITHDDLAVLREGNRRMSKILDILEKRENAITACYAPTNWQPLETPDDRRLA